MPVRTQRTAIVTTILVVGGLFLAGCTNSPSPSHTPTPSSVDTAVGNNLGMTCKELIPNDVVTALHPHLVHDPSFVPDPGSYPGKIRALGGLACEWTEPNSENLVVAVVKLTPAQLASNEAAVKAGSTSTLAFGDSADVRGYYANTGGTYSGDVEVFTSDGYWVSAVSALFLNASDAESVVGAALQAVPSG